uniref:Serpin domain-containing protein n=1 Tax=Pygocentrus nattereri TaxID=42514 RepID=A0A3B4EDM6_PYGNA
MSSLLAPHNADFTFSLYKKLAAHPEYQGKNIFFSPLSISMALSMLALGAKGETHSQIFSTLGYSALTPDQVNEGYEHLLHMLSHSQDTMLLEAGSAVAVREGFKPLDKFLKDAQHYYQGEAFSVDFSKPEVAVQEVNKYIAKKTKDMITDMVKELDPDTVMMLINFIYFRGTVDT